MVIVGRNNEQDQALADVLQKITKEYRFDTLEKLLDPV
jgi:hypothetical protein